MGFVYAKNKQKSAVYWLKTLNNLNPVAALKPVSFLNQVLF